MSLKLLLTIAVLACAAPVFAQAPNGVHVVLPDGNSYVQSTNTSGTLSHNGMTCTWATTASSATINFSGTYTTTWQHPSIDLYWFSSPEMPLAVSITEAGVGTYDFAAPFNTGTWDNSINFDDLSGDWAWGNRFPECSRFDLDINLNDQSTTYDTTIEVHWGEGVAADADSWSGIKALYR
jgi:hypothetical protein